MPEKCRRREKGASALLESATVILAVRPCASSLALCSWLVVGTRCPSLPTVQLLQRRAALNKPLFTPSSVVAEIGDEIPIRRVYSVLHVLLTIGMATKSKVPPSARAGCRPLRCGAPLAWVRTVGERASERLSVRPTSLARMPPSRPPLRAGKLRRPARLQYDIRGLSVDGHRVCLRAFARTPLVPPVHAVRCSAVAGREPAAGVFPDARQGPCPPRERPTTAHATGPCQSARRGSRFHLPATGGLCSWLSTASSLPSPHLSPRPPPLPPAPGARSRASPAGPGPSQ